jgi:hypothetical protein
MSKISVRVSHPTSTSHLAPGKVETCFIEASPLQTTNVIVHEHNSLKVHFSKGQIRQKGDSQDVDYNDYN